MPPCVICIVSSPPNVESPSVSGRDALRPFLPSLPPFSQSLPLRCLCPRVLVFVRCCFQFPIAQMGDVLGLLAFST